MPQNAAQTEGWECSPAPMSNVGHARGRPMRHAHGSSLKTLVAYALWPLMRREAVTGATRALRC
eukprot:2573998-Prymnesium_polylepis.1